ISSESKTPKMTETALECITILTNGRYVSDAGHDGRDGGLSFLGYVVESITRASDSASEVVQGGMAKALLAIMTCPKCGVHEAAMLQAVRSTFHVYLVGKTPVGKELARKTLVDMLKCVFNRMEAYDIINQDDAAINPISQRNGEDERTVATAITAVTCGSPSTTSKDRTPSSPTENGMMEDQSGAIGMFASQYHTDSYLLFRALCKLSSKTLPGDENVGMSTTALNSKVLSLELILAVFEHCGDAFRNGEKFIYAVQSYLCVSLLKNCMSNQTAVAHLSLKIFLLLVKKFKTHLKAEIEVFVLNIFLRVLESPNSPFEQKVLVLEALRALCSDPQMLTQLFLNYDCDFDAVNLYKDIVHHVTRISAKACAPSSTSAPVTKKDADQELELSRTGLEVLVVILRSFLKALDLPDIQAAGFAEKIVDAFDKKRTAQQNFEIGMVKFTLSLKSGISFFIESGFVDLDAQDMARFLYENKERLDKTQVGEVLGKEPDAAFGFFLRVLYHYVDQMKFEGLKFDDAIRLFLSGFRLPGEAQKIDRIMEKFAERFTRQNSDVFPSADTAFILAFSVIMLNTDLHNPSIKPERRMTLESFIRNNKGISADGGDLPQDFLTGIFNRIKEQPFSLKEDDEAREKANKEKKFRKEREEMMTASEQLFKKRSGKGSSRKLSPESSIDSVSPGDVVKPMFDVTWGPLIGTLSQVLESSTNETSIALCLSGFVYSIRLSSHSGMSLARNTFVNSLAKFTTLGSIKEMKSKNIECIRTLLSIAIIDGEYLGESWSPILQCISQLGRLHLFASGLDSEDQFLQSGSLQLSKISDAAREMEENNGKAVLAAINEILIDKVFSSTVTLSARGIVNFIEQLIAVSEAEISGPRIFSLQRLVEVADYNMNIRPRLTWSQIWETMGRHFAKVGCDDNAMVSMFAIDALRQLSLKFLEKPELTDFNFQRLFLKPFLLIIENPGSREDIRELVLRCVDNIIRSLAHNLRSGWKIFFMIL
ncbi:ArfGEF, partial [Thalassiosira pseudonana CCMP1335]